MSSNEAVNGSGDGNTSTDWQVVDAHHVQLRAERSGNGDGRIYTITLTCTDAAGNKTVRTATVMVRAQPVRRSILPGAPLAKGGASG